MVKRGQHLGGLKELSVKLKPKESFLIIGGGASALWLKHPSIRWNDYTIITVNCACLLCKCDIWMSFDRNSWLDTWWGDARAKYHLLGEQQEHTARGHQKYYPQNFYTFEHERSIMPNNDRLEKFKLKGGATISGCAIQLAASFDSTKTIHVTGCDMYDANTHFYDSEKPPVARGTEWSGSQAMRLAWIMRECEGKGIDVAHIGFTAMSKYGVKEVIPK